MIFFCETGHGLWELSPVIEAVHWEQKLVSFGTEGPQQRSARRIPKKTTAIISVDA